MVKLKRLSVCGFRGILAPLTIDLTHDGQPCSAVIYGRNGTGKSSLTDSWEWLWCERVDHLAREGAEQGSYPHVAAAPGDTWVEAEFDQASLGTVRLAFDSHRVTKPARSGNFDAVHAVTPHPCHIRFADLGEFVFRKKTERYDHLARLMGFSFQVELQKALRRVQRQLNQQVVRLRDNTTTAEHDLSNKIGGTAADIGQLRAQLAPRFQRQGISAEASWDSLQRSLQLLRERVTRDPVTQRHANLRSLGTAIKHIRPDPSPVDAADRYVAALAPLRASEQTIKNLHLLGLYERGLKAIDSQRPDRCPLCGKDYPGELASHIEAERQKLQALQQSVEQADAARQQLQSAVTRPQSAVEPVRAALEPLSTEAFAPQVEQLLRSVTEQERATSSISPLCSKPVQETAESDSAAISGLAAVIRSELASASQARGALLVILADQYRAIDADPTRAQLAADFETVAFALERWPQLQQLRDQLRNIEAVIATFDQLVDRYATACLVDVQQRFAQVSHDLSTFFSLLEESTDGLADPVLKVLPDQERSVVLEIAFHGNVVSPAYKYLSESQLNSFGLAVFLASAKRFNPGFGFLLLDDVVNSLDGYKRPRLLTLLKHHFADYQVLLLTHDDVWRDRITRVLPSWKRMHFKRLEFGVGPIVADLPSSVEVIETLLSDDKPRLAGQVLGPAMEDELQDLCQSFEARVTYNRKNEYTLEPLLNAFTQRVKDKLGPTHALPVACAALVSESGFRNLCAHEKNPAIPLSTDEMASVLVRWQAVLVLTRCAHPPCRGDLLAWNGSSFRCPCGHTILARP